jgi:hypothetical protein
MADPVPDSDPVVPAPVEDEPPEVPAPPEIDMSADTPLTRHIRLLRKESALRRTKLRDARARVETLEAEIERLKAAPAAAPAEPSELEATLHTETHSRLVAETVSDSDTLNPKVARALLSGVTRLSDSGALVLADDESVVVDAAVTRELLPLSLLRTTGAAGSGGGTPNPMKPASSQDARMLTSQSAYEKLTPAQRRQAEERLRGGPE